MKFIIASLPRCGSTAVYRVLSCDGAVKITYEPSFFDAALSLPRVRKKTRRYLAQSDGLKHVWDPNGWPFRNHDHISSVAVLADSYGVIAPNQTVLESANRIILLRRKNAFDRTLSDLWSQQTNLWGHNPHLPHSDLEAQEYRAAALRRIPSAIDADVFGWYMQNAEAWEDAIITAFLPSITKIFYYEDLFATTDRIDAWRELAAWVEVKPALLSPQVQGIICADSKFNSKEIYERIPNFRELRAEFS